MADDDGAATRLATREVVASFASTEALNAAVDALEEAGVDRAAISVLGLEAGRPAWIGAPAPSAAAPSAADLADDPAAPQGSFISSAVRSEGKGIAIAVPMDIAGFAGAWAVAAAGGALFTAIAAAALSGAAGAGVGYLLYRLIAHRHAEQVETQLASGGLLLWVRTPGDDDEHRALTVLQGCGGQSVHAHTIERDWGVADSPLHDVQPDPFLGGEKSR